MKLEIESTSNVVLIEGVPCRKWNIITVNGGMVTRESFIFSRLLIIDRDIDCTDPDVVLLPDRKPPGLAEYSEAMELDV